MPAKVDEYFKQVKEDNPGYSDSQAWATAWSIFCKHKDPDSKHCRKDRSEYLKDKNAMVLRVASSYITRDSEVGDIDSDPYWHSPSGRQ